MSGESIEHFKPVSRFAHASIFLICGAVWVGCSALPVEYDGQYWSLLSDTDRLAGSVLRNFVLVGILGGYLIGSSILLARKPLWIAAGALACIGIMGATGVDLLAILTPNSREILSFGAYLQGSGDAAGRLLVVGCVLLSAGLAAFGVGRGHNWRSGAYWLGLGAIAAHYLLPAFLSSQGTIGTGIFGRGIGPFLGLGQSNRVMAQPFTIAVILFCYFAPAIVVFAASIQRWRVVSRHEDPSRLARYAWSLRLVPVALVLPMIFQLFWLRADLIAILAVIRSSAVFVVAVLVTSVAIEVLLLESGMNETRSVRVSELPPAVP